MSVAGLGVVVVDASLALKWVLQEQHTTEAISLLRTWAAGQTHPIAPSWFACEVANVLYQRVRRGQLSIPDAQTALGTVLGGMTVRDHEPAVALRALEMADMLGQPATYDSQYLALAERESCELWTADQRFWAAASTRFPYVHWVGQVVI